MNQHTSTPLWFSTNKRAHNASTSDINAEDIPSEILVLLSIRNGYRNQ